MNIPNSITTIIIEDDEDITDLINGSVASSLDGKVFLDVYNFRTLKESMSYLYDNHCDLIFLDLHLDDGHGNAILDNLQSFKNPNATVIVISGYINEHSDIDKDNIIYLSKPFSSTQIERYINIFLGNRFHKAS